MPWTYVQAQLSVKITEGRHIIAFTDFININKAQIDSGNMSMPFEASM